MTLCMCFAASGTSLANTIYFTRGISNRYFCYTISNLFHEGISWKSPLLLYHIKSISRGNILEIYHFCYTISNLFHEGISWKSLLLLYHIKSISRGEYRIKSISEIATSVIPYQIYFSRGEYRGNRYFCYTISNLFHEGITRYTISNLFRLMRQENVEIATAS